MPRHNHSSLPPAPHHPLITLQLPARWGTIQLSGSLFHRFASCLSATGRTARTSSHHIRTHPHSILTPSPFVALKAGSCGIVRESASETLSSIAGRGEERRDSLPFGPNRRRRSGGSLLYRNQTSGALGCQFVCKNAPPPPRVKFVEIPV